MMLTRRRERENDSNWYFIQKENVSSGVAYATKKMYDVKKILCCRRAMMILLNSSDDEEAGPSVDRGKSV